MSTRHGIGGTASLIGAAAATAIALMCLPVQASTNGTPTKRTCAVNVSNTFGAATPTDQDKITVAVAWQNCSAAKRISVTTQMFERPFVGTLEFPQYGPPLVAVFGVSRPNGSATKTYRLYVYRGEFTDDLTTDRNQARIIGPYTNCTIAPQPGDNPGDSDYRFSVASKYTLIGAHSRKLQRGRTVETPCGIGDPSPTT
jgi:hypothetical protein